MALTPGSRLGVYDILAQVGEGGMGAVYRATDTSLGRQVAIKVLPDAFAEDADRLARFEREAKTLAALNHPNIAAIYGLERSGGTQALVMELVEGDDLSQRIARGAIPIDEVLPIAKQIADALEAAHGQGIIHRDLKPANIKVRPDGAVKVLDFGLAKALDTAGGPSAAGSLAESQAPTITTPAMTVAGVILGTAAYMAPEQARGKAVDKRVDIWAFGVVLFEMLTGRRVFAGEEISDTLAAVLKTEPGWGLLPADTPPALRRLLRRCLEKDHTERLPDIAAARLDIKDARAEREHPLPAVTPVVSRTSERVAWGAAVALTFIAVGAISWALRPLPVPLETRLEITTPATDDLFSFAMSPDGRRLVFVATAEGGRSQLWLRPVDQTVAQPLAGTEGASFPFWSPDSQSLAFFADNALKRLDVAGGLPRTLISTGEGASGGSWNADGVIVFARSTGPLSRVSAAGTSGGGALAVTTLGPGQTAHRFPHFLPGGRQFLFYARGGGALAGVYLGSLDSQDITRLTTADTSAQFVAPNWLLFLRQRTLFAQQVDLSRRALSGEPVPVADQVAFNSTLVAGAFSVSATGGITYRVGDKDVTQFTWFDRSGKAVGTIGEPDANNLLQPTLSPDGLRVAAFRTIENNTDVWIFDAARMIRLTFDPGTEAFPVWSPDGSRIVFGKTAKGALSLYQKAATGAGQEELLLNLAPLMVAPAAWSPDGRFLLFGQSGPETGRDIWVLPMDGKQKVYPLLNSKFEERTAAPSPDGGWVAYQSDESGRPEIYLRQFPVANGQWQASTMGGVTPRWRRDGKELYYIAPDGKLMAVSTVLTGSAPEMGTPIALFQPRILYGGTQPLGTSTQYDVAPDGRFLINITMDDTKAAPLTVVQNWRGGR